MNEGDRDSKKGASNETFSRHWGYECFVFGSIKGKKYEVPAEEINVIPTDWNKDVTPEAINAFKVWAKKIGVGY